MRCQPLPFLRRRQGRHDFAVSNIYVQRTRLKAPSKARFLARLRYLGDLHPQPPEKHAGGAGFLRGTRGRRAKDAPCRSSLAKSLQQRRVTGPLRCSTAGLWLLEPLGRFVLFGCSRQSGSGLILYRTTPAQFIRHLNIIRKVPRPCLPPIKRRMPEFLPDPIVDCATLPLA